MWRVIPLHNPSNARSYVVGGNVAPSEELFAAVLEFVSEKITLLSIQFISGIIIVVLI